MQLEKQFESKKIEKQIKDYLKNIDLDLNKLSLILYDKGSAIKNLEIEKAKKLQRMKILRSSLRERHVILPPNINILKEEIIKRGLKVKGPFID
ncbi:hypothetical protein LCGC14_2798450, partial [marine sediment metagenome]